MAPQTQKALSGATKTINNFFQHHQPFPDFRNAWGLLKIHLLTSATPPAQPSSLVPLSEALDKIQDNLALIEKRVSVPQDAAQFPLSYADAAKMPTRAPASTPEKFAPSRLLRKVTVETINGAAPQQALPRVV